MALVAANLCYTYAAGTAYEVPALLGLDVHLECGDLLVIAGTTGSGKSTLLRLLAGLLRPSSGTVGLDGSPASDRRSRGRAAMVFQNPESQFFAESLLADVSFGPRNLGAQEPARLAADALAAVGLDPDTFGDRSPFTLSGGEARRAAIAGALAMRAPYLLLDEPTAGLDRRGRRDVVLAIGRERHRAGVAVVTHDPEEFLPSATRVLALRAGETAFAGSVDELLANPSPYLEAGLRLPEVVMAQLFARDRGLPMGAIEFEPEAAAVRLSHARGARS